MDPTPKDPVPKFNGFWLCMSKCPETLFKTGTKIKCSYNRRKEKGFQPNESLICIEVGPPGHDPGTP